MATPPDGFVHRRELDEVRALLCAAADGGAVGITTALRGAGGFGKTTLAQALAFDDDVRAGRRPLGGDGRWTARERPDGRSCERRKTRFAE